MKVIFDAIKKSQSLSYTGCKMSMYLTITGLTPTTNDAVDLT